MLPSLPPEVWALVFRWATYPSDGYPASYYQPFRRSSETFDETLTTKRALVLVCRLWRALAIAFLYEDVRIRRGPADLQSTDHRRFVRRLELPYAQTATVSPGDAHDIVQILCHCPSLETLIRPYCEPSPYSAVRYEFPAESPSLPSLIRLDWWHYNNAARSGGINSLVDVLYGAPSLQYLTLGGEFWISATRHEPLRLPALTTLRLRRMNGPFVWQIKRWELPSLVHLVADFPPEHGGLEELWLHFGSRLCTVEFGRHVAFHMADHVSAFLRGCASAKVFNYYVNFTAPPAGSLSAKHAALECVGLHASPCGVLPDNGRHLNHHLAFLSGSCLPALRRIVLYGDWHHIIEDFRLSPALDHLANEGRTVMVANQLSSSLCDHL